MRSLGSTYPIILALIVFQAGPILGLSDQRLCADPKCQGTISTARAAIRYHAPEKGMVSFNINSQIRVKSKSAGKDPTLWGIEVNGRQGYAPKRFLVEEKIFIKENELKHIVPVEPVTGDKQMNVPKATLNPSEISTEEKTSEKAPQANPTPTLYTETDKASIVLNSSESDMETTTTTPLTEPINSEVVNKSIKEMATPVLNKMEIIDGTPIPVFEDIVDKENVEKKVQLSDKNEKATSKNEPIDKENANETLGNPTASNSESKDTISEGDAKASKNTKKNLEENSEKGENVVTQTLEEKHSVKLPDAVSELKDVDQNVNELKPENVSDFKNLPDTVTELQDVNENVDKIRTEKVTELTSLPDAVRKLEDVAQKVNDSLPQKVDEEILSEKPEEHKNTDSIKETETPKTAKNLAAVKSKSKKAAQATKLDNKMNTKTPTESHSDNLKNEAILPMQNKILMDAYEDGEDDFDDDDEDEDDDDEIDGEDEENDSDEKYKPIFQSSSTEYTTETPQTVTDSGFTATTNMNYWEDADVEVTTATPVPKNDPNASSSNKSEKKSTDENKSTENLSSTASSTAATKSTGSQEMESTPKLSSEVDAVVNEAIKKEAMTTETPQVPETTTVLPIIHQPIEPQVESQNQEIENEQEQGIEKVDSENPNQEIKNDQEPPIPKNFDPYPYQPIQPHLESQNQEQRIEKVDSENPNQQVKNEQEPPIPKIFDPYQTVIKKQQQQQENQQNNQQTNERLSYEDPNDYYRHQSEPNSMESTKSADLPVSTEAPLTSERLHNTGTPEPVAFDHNTASFEEKDKNLGTDSIEMITTTPSPLSVENGADQTSTQAKIYEKRDSGLFGTILGTVNTFVNKLHKQEPQAEDHKSENAFSSDDELKRILYPERYAAKINAQEGENEYCEQLSPEHCPKSKVGHSSVYSQQCKFDWSHINMDSFVEIFVAKAFEMRELLSCLAIASSTILIFLFGYYCFGNSSREGTLISKLNLLERSLLASHKENTILKDDLQKTRNKLTSIENNSFGSNDMVIDLRKELEINAEEKRQMEQQIQSLEKELETAAEAGLELNKIVAELINNQTGQESMIMNSVEDLQLQFNEQQKTILEINANLAEKSRENSELQLMLAEQNVRFNGEIASLQQDNDELEAEKGALQTRLDELKTEFEEDISKALEGKNAEIKRLQNEIVDLKNRFENIHTKWQTGLAKIEALEECMKTLKKDPSVNIADVINVVNVRAELLDLQKQRSTLKSRLDMEMEARQHAEHGLQSTISEIDKLKQDFHQSEKDKLEAQTRLEVLSNYFKEKETQLQKELSLKEAIWLKQQGENTNTVDRLTSMQDEIQSLKSQNDALRAEIEAQLAAHKAQIGTLENRAHETWLAARQSERRFEEARAEAAALRRRLTELAGAAASNGGESNNRNNVDGRLPGGDFNNAPSPIMPPPAALMDANAGSPLLGTLPPPPHQFLPFMGPPPPPPFLNLPPPPFLQSVEMRPAPLGRMMSPTSGRYSPPPSNRERKRHGNDYYGGREYDDDYDDDDDYDVEEDDYDYDDDEDEQDERTRSSRPRRRSGNGSDSEWHRDNFSPPPPDRSYRSQSPTDSRYNYTYEDETDLSPPPSPPGRRGRGRDGGGGGSRTGSYHTFSPRSALHQNASTNAVVPERTSKKGIPNSDSDKSHNSAHQNKKGNSSLV